MRRYGDVVGMSTAAEVNAAIRHGLPVRVLSLVANASGAALGHAEVLAAGALLSADLGGGLGALAAAFAAGLDATPAVSAGSGGGGVGIDVVNDIIAHKRDGGRLDEARLRAFVAGVVDGSIPAYQASALLMAIVLRGFSPDETLGLARAMVESGKVSISRCWAARSSTSTRAAGWATR